MNQEQLDRIPIGNGIHLNFIENDRFKTNTLSVYLVSALNENTASHNALLSRTLLRGTAKYPTQRELNCALDSSYDAQLSTDVVRAGEMQALDLSLTLLDNAFALGGEDITSLGTALLREVLFAPLVENGAFRADYVESEKRNALDEIRAEINNKAHFSRRRMIEIMCKGESYSTDDLGAARTIRRITPESLFAYYNRLLQTSVIEIFFVGRGNKEKMARQWKEIFSGTVREPVIPEKTLIRSRVAKRKDVTEEMEITQANLVMGFRTGISLNDKDWRAMSVYNAILGGSLTSKLFCVVREKMSLCYTISSSADALKGIMLIYAGIAPDKKEVTVREISRQMQLITAGEITDEELESARGALINSLRGLPDNPAILGEWYLPRILSENFVSPSGIISELEAVKKEDVMAVSKKIMPDTTYFLTGKEGAANE